MATISEQLANVRTIQDAVNLLMVLFTNLNNQNEMYYDMFLNPVPMDLELERYDENGELVTVTIPNRAKDRLTTYSGAGDPNGNVAASPGALYIDTVTYNLYYKGYGSDSHGWITLWSTRNLDYLSPTGDASGLTNLNMNNAGSGVLSVTRGGTGAVSINGLVKGNGTSAFTKAIDGVDYLGPNSMIGIICYYPIYDNSLPNYGLPSGWLRCDGYDGYLRTDYPNLFAKIGTKYGNSNSETFAVPNLIDKYIKCYNGSTVGVSEEGQVGKHLHALSGTTGSESAHTHSRGTMNITGSFGNVDRQVTANGAFYVTGASGGWHNESETALWMNFDASRAWTGNTSGGSAHTHSLEGLDTAYNVVGSSDKNEVDHVTMVPIIKY